MDSEEKDTGSMDSEDMQFDVRGKKNKFHILMVTLKMEKY